MIDLSNLTKDENIFLKEFSFYNHILDIVNSENISQNSKLLDETLNSMSEQYLHLLKQAVKLVKISDSNQLKLRNAQTKLKEQNKLIDDQNKLLTKANFNQEKLLNLLNHELSKAADYVKSLLPKPFINNKTGLSVDWKFEPSSKLGGDMFGYKMIDSEHLVLFLFDVCGHGIGPALYSVSVFNALNNQNLIYVDFLSPSSVFRGLNKLFNMRAHNDMYFTMWYGVLNINTLKLTFAAAGHPPAILISPIRNNELPKSENFFIGGIANYKYEEASCYLSKGDSLYVFSDGAYEIRIDENTYMQLDELEEFIKLNHHDNHILDLIYSHIQHINFDSDLADDFSIMKINL